MISRDLHLRIDRILVEGLPAESQHRFVKALEGRLAEMAKEGLGGSGASMRRLHAVDAGRLRPGASAEQAAAQVAHAIRRAIAPTKQAGLQGDKAGRIGEKTTTLNTKTGVNGNA